MGLPPLVLSPSYFTPLLPLVEQSPFSRYLDNREYYTDMLRERASCPFLAGMLFYAVTQGARDA